MYNVFCMFAITMYKHLFIPVRANTYVSHLFHVEFQNEVGHLRTRVVELETELSEARREEVSKEGRESAMSHLTSQLNTVRAER